MANPYENLAFLVDTLNSVQKIRQSTGNRIAHLAKQRREDEIVEGHHKSLQSLEDSLVESIEPIIKSHPTWKWAERIKGVGVENLAKVVGLIEKVEDNGRYAVECFDTPSKLVRFCGLAPVDGRAERRIPGEKLHYNAELRTMLWRVAGSLLRAKGKFYDYYSGDKDYLQARYGRDGYKIMPTPTGKFCPKCLKQVKVKTAKSCPDCGGGLYTKKEPEGIIFEGHLHNSALRRMIRMFVIMLYVAWREELALPVREPYPVERLGHSQILKPEDFCDI